MTDSPVPPTDCVDGKVLLDVLAKVKVGDFTARMPLEWTGVAGKVADSLNEVIIANQTLEKELARVSRVVGTGGRALTARGHGWLGAELVGQPRGRQQPDRCPGATHQ